MFRIMSVTDMWDYGAAVAQGTHNPLVVGSNPSGPIFLEEPEKALF